MRLRSTSCWWRRRGELTTRMICRFILLFSSVFSSSFFMLISLLLILLFYSLISFLGVLKDKVLLMNLGL